MAPEWYDPTGVSRVTETRRLAHRVPGKWIGIAVLANTFRHPAVVAKAATVLDNATEGRFILGLGASVAGEPLEASQKALERLDYNRLLAEADRAKRAAAERTGR